MSGYENLTCIDNGWTATDFPCTTYDRYHIISYNTYTAGLAGLRILSVMTLQSSIMDVPHERGMDMLPVLNGPLFEIKWHSERTEVSDR